MRIWVAQQGAVADSVPSRQSPGVGCLKQKCRIIRINSMGKIIISSVFGLILGSFALWIYSFISVVKLQKKLQQCYPNEAEKIFGFETIFGINIKQGIMILMDADVKRIAERDRSVNILRKHAVISTVSFITIIPLFVVLWLFAIIFGNMFT
jgi:hypothetical protein